MPDFLLLFFFSESDVVDQFVTHVRVLKARTHRRTNTRYDAPGTACRVVVPFCALGVSALATRMGRVRTPISAHATHEVITFVF